MSFDLCLVDFFTPQNSFFTEFIGINSECIILGQINYMNEGNTVGADD